MIRPATSADAEAILEVMFSTAMSKESSWWKNTPASIAEKLTAGGGFVADEEGRVIGCVLHVFTDGDLVMRSLAVRPEYEGRGVGTALVKAVEAEAMARGIPRILLAVSASNLEVCGYYLRLGYLRSEEPYPHAVPGRPSPVVFTKTVPMNRG